MPSPVFLSTARVNSPKGCRHGSLNYESMRLLRYCLPVVCLFAFLGVPAPSDATPKPERTPVLSGNVVPISYDLTIEPKKWDFNGGTADGNETIIVNIHHATRGITMNAFAGITILSATIDGAVAETTKFPIEEQMEFSTGKSLTAGRHTITLRFIGKILSASDSGGLWENAFSRKHPTLVSFFEPATARSLFPCFDEPRFRAHFSIHVIAPSTWKVISNMPIAQVTALPKRPGKSTFSFAKTPDMPTYLLTLDMGDFSQVTGRFDQTPITVYVRPGKEALARSVLHTAGQTLTFYEHFFSTPFPLPKLDLVISDGALQSDFEGYGAVTFYTESVLEGLDSSDPLKGKRDAFEAVAQPIAQQWFGGLVGIKSWSNSWLTTSLTSWAVARAEAKLRPEFHVLPADIDWTWNFVSLWGSLKPLHYAVNDDRDTASYTSFFASATDAGQAVLDQWDAYVGDPTMRNTVQKFFSKYRGRGTTNAAFWKMFGTSQASGYGNSWLNEPGAPVVQAAFTCVHSRQILSLKQARIFDAEFHDRKSTVWPIPLSWTTNGKTHWIMLEGKPRQLDAGSCADTTVIDAGFRPTYLVHLSAPELKRLNRDTALSAVDRMRVFRDTFSLMTAHQATLPEYLVALHIATQMPRPQSFGYTLRDSLRGILQYLAGSPELPIVSKSINDSLHHAFLPEDLHSGKLLNLQNGLYWELAIIPDRRFAREALASWRKDRSKMRTPEDIALMTYSGTAGTPDDFTWVMHHILTGCNPHGWLPADPMPFLFGAHTRATVLRIFTHMQNKDCDYPGIVSRIGYYQPKIVADYIVTHAHDIMRSAPPSQQAWTLTDSIVNGAWAGRTPTQWRTFLQHTLSPADAPAIHDAMMKIEAKWARRRLLEAQLAAMK